MVFVSEDRPGPSTTPLPPGVKVTTPSGKVVTGSSSDSSSTTDTSGKKTRYDNTIPVAYRPPVYGTADRQEYQVQQYVKYAPKIYTAQTVGDLWNAYNSDPASRSFVEAAARAHFGNAANYSSFNDSWIQNWFGSVVNSATAEGSQPAWMILQNTLAGNDPTSSSSSRSSGSGSYGGGGYSGGGGGGGGQVSLASPSQAQGLLTQFMQSTVGRDPKPDEVRKFVELLQGYQSNNPSTVTINGNNVVQSGGVDPNVVAQEFVQTLPDYTESQADKYYRAFMGALIGGAA